MKMNKFFSLKIKLLFISVVLTIFFTYFSYTVARERWQKIDFDTTVKLQDRISGKIDSSITPSTNLLAANPERNRKIDGLFSYFSLLGSAEVTVGFCLFLSFWALIKRGWLGVVGWLMIMPATVAEIFGKLIVFHPGPPKFFHRSLLPTNLPSFYVHTNFSYPSGHMTRTIFIITIFILLILFSTRNVLFKFITISALLLLASVMGVTRVYLGEHWLSDVLGGTLLGLAAGCFASILILRPAQVFDSER